MRPRTVLDLAQAPTPSEAFAGLSESDRARIEPVVRRLPLQRALEYLTHECDGTGVESSRKVYLVLALALIRQFPAPAAAYGQVVDCMLRGDRADIKRLVRVATQKGMSRPLFFTMSEVQASLLAMGGLVEGWRAWLEALTVVSERIGTEVDRIAVHQYRAMLELSHGDLERADAAAASALLVAIEAAPWLLDSVERMAADIGLKRVLAGDLPAIPEPLDGFLEKHPERHILFVLALGNRATGRMDLPTAQQLSDKAVALAQRLGDPRDPRVLLLQARIARRSGSYEIADLLLAEVRISSRRSEVEMELAFESRRLEEDLGLRDDSQTFVGSSPERTDRSQYRQAVETLNRGEVDAGRELLETLMKHAVDPDVRLDSMATLGTATADLDGALALLYKAIGKYVALDRRCDLAISLADLGDLTRHFAVAKTIELRSPPEMIGEFDRAERLYRDAGFIFQALGVEPQVTGIRQRLAALAEDRGDLEGALRELEEGVVELEAQYLLVSNNEAAASIARSSAPWYERAVSLCLQLGRHADALVVAERAKSRRLLRDRSDLTVVSPAPDTGDRGSAVVADIAQIRRRLRAMGIVTIAERRTLLEKASSVLARSSGWEDPTLEPAHAFGIHAIVCPRCLADNALASVYCSACETLLAKTAETGLSMISEEDGRQMIATTLYNRGQLAFRDQDFTEAESLFRQALEVREHQDYLFFLGLCVLVRKDAEEAVECFSRVFELQFQSFPPAWYPPAAPSAVRTSIADLSAGARSPRAVLVALIEHEVDTITRRRSVQL